MANKKINPNYKASIKKWKTKRASEKKTKQSK